MKELQFITARRADWLAWDQWLAAGKAAGKASGKQAAKVAAVSGVAGAPGAAGSNSLKPETIGKAFRQLCHDLTMARSRQYSSVLQDDLQQRVLAVHQRIYQVSVPRRGVVFEFIGGGFPRLVREEWRLVLAASLLFFGPLFLMLVLAHYVPASVDLLLSAQEQAIFRGMYNPEATRLGQIRGVSSNWVMTAYYIANNVKIGFQVFATGVTFGVGTVFYTLLNGFIIGATAGYLTELGYIETFWGFVAGHSAFELTGIVLASAAGLRLGMALIAPGQRSRVAALRHASRNALGLIYGAASLIFLAAFIEGFWSPQRDVTFSIKIGVGVTLWILTWAYLLLAGRGRRAA